LLSKQKLGSRWVVVGELLEAGLAKPNMLYYYHQGFDYPKN
jgi:hypothetical protein